MFGEQDQEFCGGLVKLEMPRWHGTHLLSHGPVSVQSSVTQSGLSVGVDNVEKVLKALTAFWGHKLLGELVCLLFFLSCWRSL